MHGAPQLIVKSGTLVENLNADRLDGYEPVTHPRADTIALRNSNGDLSANTLWLTPLNGVPPIVTTSALLNTNLNADMVDGMHATDSPVGKTISARSTSGDLYGVIFRPMINVLGVPPLVLQPNAPARVVSLNADMVDGFHASDFIRSTDTDTVYHCM